MNERELYEKMVLIRRFDEAALELRRSGETYGSMHPYIGEEAIAVGVCAHLTPRDRITSTHRGHGHCLAKGADPARMFAELFGRRDGYCAGKGGSMHIADFEVGMLGANGIVAAGMAIAAGSALVSKFENDGSVAVAFFGDGALGAGPLHENLNISALWQLPVVWVCENNGWAVGNPSQGMFAPESAVALASTYGIPAVAVDGNDVIAVTSAAGEAVARARDNGGPSLISATTYRMLMHAYRDGDGVDSRPAQELESWRRRDPIAAMKASLISKSAISEQQDTAIYAEVDRIICEAIEFARNSPEPPLETALANVFSD